MTPNVESKRQISSRRVVDAVLGDYLSRIIDNPNVAHTNSITASVVGFEIKGRHGRTGELLVVWTFWLRYGMAPGRDH
ncbi:MAG: hypothetical protein L0Z50_37100 [Verrucomicrobiales bacterium]|nr:hypothetical protein [Verrucomicrobiales bacterium]